MMQLSISINRTGRIAFINVELYCRDTKSKTVYSCGRGRSDPGFARSWPSSAKMHSMFKSSTWSASSSMIWQPKQYDDGSG